MGLIYWTDSHNSTEVCGIKMLCHLDLPSSHLDLFCFCFCFCMVTSQKSQRDRKTRVMTKSLIAWLQIWLHCVFTSLLWEDIFFLGVRLIIKKWYASVEQINCVKHSWAGRPASGHHRAKLMVVATERTWKTAPFSLLYDMNRDLGVAYFPTASPAALTAVLSDSWMWDSTDVKRLWFPELWGTIHSNIIVWASV